MDIRPARRWLEHSYGPGDAEQIVRRLAEQFVSEFQEEPNDDGFVVSGAALLNCAERVGVISFASPRLGRMAYLTPRDSGFQLSLRLLQSGKASYRVGLQLELERNPAARWMFAHELGHTLFYTRGSGTPRKAFESNGADEERLCQQFAAELLMPYARLRRQFACASDVTAESLVSVARRFGAPLKAVARRFLFDLGILRATCVIISKEVAQTWPKRVESGRPLPKSGVEIFSHASVTHDLTDEDLLANRVVRQLCVSGSYCNSTEFGCGTEEGFVEGLRLYNVPPRDARLFLFHPRRPRFTDRPLFDLIKD